MTVEVDHLGERLETFVQIRKSLGVLRREDERETAFFKGYLKEVGDRELWDGERNVGVALEESGGARWVDLSGLSDEVVLWAARHACLQLNSGGFDAMAKLADEGAIPKEDRELLSLFRHAIKQGGRESLVVLPKERR